MLLRLRHLAEYAGLRFGLLLADHLPLAVAEGLAVRLANAGFLLHRRRRRIASENILRAGITTDPAKAHSIAKASFSHFAVLVLESLRSSSVLRQDTWKNHVQLEVAPETQAILDTPEKGAILVSAHLGNWEVAAQLISFMKPVVGITSNMNNPYTDKLMKKRKPRNQFRLTPKRDADMGRLITVIKKGEILALMADQYARKGGMMIDFFGTPASTHTSPAMLHLVTGVPIIFGYCIRTGRMSYRMVAKPPIIREATGKRKEDVRAILLQLTSEMENAIRETPSQYLWAHRRWRHLKEEGI